MALIKTADERLREKSAIKGVILGPSGIGKTTLAKTLDPAKALFIDYEAGMLAVEGWGGDSINVRHTAQEMGLDTWSLSRAIACLLAGPDPSKRPDQPYSQAHFAWCVENVGDPAQLFGKYETVFIDSITVAGRSCFQWCKGQPEAFNKDGKPDTRGAYGLHGQEMVAWMTHLQHTPQKNVWLVGILDEKVDDYGRRQFVPQIDGSATGLALPGIVDQVITMTELEAEGGQKYRGFVCQKLNHWGFPAKDRSGRLDVVEEPHLGKLMAKISAGRRQDVMVTGLPEGAGEPEIPFPGEGG